MTSLQQNEYSKLLLLPMLEKCLARSSIELRRTDTGYSAWFPCVGIKAAEAETLPLLIARLAKKLYE